MTYTVDKGKGGNLDVGQTLWTRNTTQKKLEIFVYQLIGIVSVSNVMTKWDQHSEHSKKKIKLL